ncbi:trichohyalin-like [Ptychodera flava]|uniref:trichohyalin-like n=1 Tax=Ptychodera flava TaxID=63121 RepID=UPI00396A4E04
MCAAVPIIIPEKSQSHELVRVHMPEYEESVVVDMSKSDKLRDHILEFLCNYKVALKRANSIRTELERKVAPELENINNNFVRVVKEDAENKHGIVLKGEKQPTWKKRVFQHVIDKIKTKGKTEPDKPSRKRKIQERDPGDMKVKVRVSEVVAQRGRTVEEVERDFYASDEVKEKTEEVRQELDGQHSEMEVNGIGQESISFTMSCQSLDALEFLRSEHEKGRLQDMMEDKFLSEKLLDKIGAFHLEIDVTIDYEEYFLCRKELIQKYGLPVQQKGTNNILRRKQDTTERAFTRVNRARELLREFEMEGNQATEDQINILDQLLQEKEERRRRDLQESVQESEAQKLELQKHTEHMVKDPAVDSQLKRLPGDSAFAQITDVHLLSDEEITEKNEALEAKVSKLTISSGMVRSQNRDRGRGREDLQSEIVEGDRVEERKFNTIFSEFVGVKSETRDLEINHPEVVMKAEKLSAYADDIVREAEIPEETKEVYLKVRQVERG